MASTCSASAAFAEADSHGSVKSGHVSDPRTMFDDVYATMPRHLREQREEVGR
jgi:2-oxoisovalerate dehydrogenase E1 component alpha subunit